MVLLEAGHDAEVRLAVLQNVGAIFCSVVMLIVPSHRLGENRGTANVIQSILNSEIYAPDFKFVHLVTGQWYFVFRRRMRPLASVVFQQKLHPSAGPSLAFGQCPNC